MRVYKFFSAGTSDRSNLLQTTQDKKTIQEKTSNDIIAENWKVWVVKFWLNCLNIESVIVMIGSHAKTCTTEPCHPHPTEGWHMVLA